MNDSIVSVRISALPYTLPAYCSRIARYAFLIKVLAAREIKIRYTRTFLGIAWLFVQPFLSVLVYSFFFGKVINLDTGTIPYPSFVFSGLVIWQLFTGVSYRGCTALIESADLVNKVTFPRFIIVLSKMIPVFLESVILLFVLFGFLVFTSNVSFTGIVISIFIFIQTAIFSFGVALFLSIFAIVFRDTVQVVPFLLSFAIWLTPVFYPVSLIPAPFGSLLSYLNPLSHSISGIRGALFFNKGFDLDTILLFLFSFILLLLSFFYFVRFDKKIAERL